MTPAESPCMSEGKVQRARSTSRVAELQSQIEENQA